MVGDWPTITHLGGLTRRQPHPRDSRPVTDIRSRLVRFLQSPPVQIVTLTGFGVLFIAGAVNRSLGGWGSVGVRGSITVNPFGLAIGVALLVAALCIYKAWNRQK
jgi:hypothetical protein